jgi:thioesterase domain-containing protein/aryl carrier-like protein
VGRHDNFFELGGDSLAAMRLINLINARFGANLPIRSLFESPTIEALSVGMRFEGPASGAGRLLPLRSGGQGPNLFCIHPAGGHVFCYLPIARELDPDQSVFGLQASGLEAGESLPSSVEEMAADYIAAIRKVQSAGPYRLLGMSSGGLVAFEMAQQLKRAGQEVSLLALLDTSVPGSPSEMNFSDASLLRALAAEFGCLDLLDGDAPPKTLSELLDHSHRAGRVPTEFRLEHAERIADVFRNMVRMHSAYQPGRWDGPMLLVRALRRLRDGDVAPDWSGHVSGELRVVDFDCGHSDLVTAEMAPAIGALIGVSQSDDQPSAMAIEDRADRTDAFLLEDASTYPNGQAR